MKKRIAIIIGTRPEAIKLIPVYFAFKHSEDFLPIIINTGQHLEMVDQIFDFFEIEPDVKLRVMTGNQSLSTLTAKLAEQLGSYIASDDISAVVVQGDTTSALMASLIGFYNKIKVIHVEAGLRTNNKYSPFPEEMNRKIIGNLADIHFCPTEQAVSALVKDNVRENIFNVGNTVIDSLLLTYNKVKANDGKYKNHFKQIFDIEKKIVLITGHRRENFGDGMKNICEAILELSEKHENFEFVYPVHLNPNIQKTVKDILGSRKNIHLLEPLPYDYMVYLMNKSYIILTDSGGIQEEAPSFGKPLLVLRDTTERPEGIEAGCAVLVGTDKEKIVSTFNSLISSRDLYSKMSDAVNPYGDGKSSERILKQCLAILN